MDLRGVSRWYGNVVAVNDVTMVVAPGGHRPARPQRGGQDHRPAHDGRFLAPSRGPVRVAGVPAWRNPDIYRTLGLVSEREAVHAFLTGWEFVLVGARLHRLPDPGTAARRPLDLVKLTDAWDRRIGTYSKGMRQRARVAAALVHDPQVLMLDEPFNGLDPRQRMHMMDPVHRLGAEGRTILFSSHILEEIEQVSGTVQVIVAGRLAASGDYGRFTRALLRIALTEGIRVRRLIPSNESLERVFPWWRNCDDHRRPHRSRVCSPTPPGSAWAWRPPTR